MSLGTPKFQGRKLRNRGNFLKKRLHHGTPKKTGSKLIFCLFYPRGREALGAHLETFFGLFHFQAEFPLWMAKGSQHCPADPNRVHFGVRDPLFLEKRAATVEEDTYMLVRIWLRILACRASFIAFASWLVGDYRQDPDCLVLSDPKNDLTNYFRIWIGNFFLN